MAKKQPTWGGYTGSGYYNASGVAALQAQLANYTTDQNSLRQQAEAAYNPAYNAQNLSLKQQLETALSAYNNQLSGLGQTYDLQRRSANSQYDQSLSTAMNSLTKRGLGRSSVVGTTSASIEGSRGQALADIGTKESDAYSDIYSNMSNAQNQNAASLKQLSDDYQTQITNKINELAAANNTSTTNLLAQIAALQQAGYNAYVSQWNKTHKKSGGSGGKSSGSGSSSTGSAGSADYSGSLSGGTQGNWFATGYR